MNSPAKKYQLNTFDIFQGELEFWADTAETGWPEYSYEFARTLEKLVIEHFKSDSPEKIKQAPEYDAFIRKNYFSSLTGFTDESPFGELPNESDLSEDIRKKFNLFSRLAYWTEEFIVPKEFCGSNFFEFLFAFSLRQSNITEIFPFLDFHLADTFNNGRQAFIKYLIPLTKKYSETLFTEIVTETIFEWVELEKGNLFSITSIERTLPIEHSFQLSDKKYAESLVNVLDGLKKHGFVASTTTLPNFKKVFSGEEVINPVVWTGNQSELKIFIQHLHRGNKKIKPLHHRIWKVTVKCFVAANGDIFDWKKFSSQQKPVKSNILASIADGL